jgi:signal transduction histidine kinase
MGRRALGAVIFFAVGALVFAGLGWVTVAGLGVEDAQRQAAAQAVVSDNLRVALYRLDLRMTPILTLEDSRPYDHYATDPAADGTPPSPLLNANLPPWMPLHWQCDPETGWQSPQVPPADVAERFRAFGPEFVTPNATPERRALLATCEAKFPAPQAAEWLSGRERQLAEPPAPSPGAVPVPAPPFGLGDGSTNGLSTTTDPPPKSAPAPAAPPVGNADPAAGGRAGVTLNRPQGANYRVSGGETPDADKGPAPGTEGVVTRPESAGRSTAPPQTPLPPGPRGPAPVVPSAPLESFQTQPQQMPAPNDPAAAGGAAAAPRPSLRAGNEPDNNNGESKTRANLLEKGRDEARGAGQQSQFGRGYAAPNPAGNSTPNNPTPPVVGGSNRVPPGQPKTPGELYLHLKDHPSSLAAGSPAPPGGGGPVGPAGPPASPGPPVAMATPGPTGAAPAAGTEQNKLKGDAGYKNVAPSGPMARGGGVGAGGLGGGMPGFGAGIQPLAPKTEPKKDETAAKKREADGSKADTTDGKLMRETEATRRSAADREQGRSVALLGLQFKLVEDLHQLHEKLSDEFAKADEQRKRVLAAKPKGAAAEDRSRDGDRPTAKPEADRLGAGLQADKQTEKEAKPLGEADGGKDVPAEPKPEPKPEPFAAAPQGPPIAVHLGPMRPQWLTGRDGSETLVLVRVAKRGDGKTLYQGVVLDWPRLEEELKEVVKDLFPEAKLVPVKDPDGVSPDRAMRTLPVQLDPGPAPPPPPAGWTPLRMGLVLAWVAAVIAFAAVGFSGWSLIDLAERRIRFVSAVTHELRTPLTSLRLYLDLLLSGMVQDEQKRTEYLATLNAESDRLHRLIDNVLDFARLERRRTRADTQKMRVGDLLETIRQTWTDRCGNDGKELVVVSTLPPEQEVCTDPYLVGQIVGNLIDNARKYTRDAADPRIWLWAKPEGRRWVVFEVEDRGPGVPPGERRTIFRPFRRGDSADTRAGGAGLGLALAKQWAEALGGRLTYRPADGGTGACFRLELRVR